MVIDFSSKMKSHFRHLLAKLINLSDDHSDITDDFLFVPSTVIYFEDSIVLFLTFSAETTDENCERNKFWYRF